MKNNSFLLIFFLLTCIITVYSCKNNSVDEYIPELRLQDAEKTVSLKLSDLGKDFRLIRLETDTSYLISNISDYLIGEKYIIINTPGHLLQYSVNGDFICCLAEKGRGPGEFESVSTMSANSNETCLYLHDYGETGIDVFDLNTGSYIGFIRFFHGGKAENAILTDDNKLAVIPSPREDTEYMVYYQDLNSELINGIKQDRDGTWLPSMSRSQPFPIGDKLYYFNTTIFGDTVYSIDGISLSPLFYLNGGPLVDHIEMSDGFSPFLDNITDKYALLRNIYFKVSGDENTIIYRGNEIKYYYYDISSGELFEVSEVVNDIFDFTPVKDNDLFLLFNNLRLDFNNKRIGLWWDVYNFLENFESVSIPELAPGLREQFDTIINGISTNDNPVMLIGELK